MRVRVRVRCIGGIRLWVRVKECVQRGGGVLGRERHLLEYFSGRVCFSAKNSWVRGTLLQKQKGKRDSRIEVRESRRNEDKLVVENRTPNDSGKGSKLHFDLKKIECASIGLVTKQNKKRVRNEGIGTEKRANVREG